MAGWWMVVVSIIAIHHGRENDCDSSNSLVCIRISLCLFFTSSELWGLSSRCDGRPHQAVIPCLDGWWHVTIMYLGFACFRQVCINVKTFNLRQKLLKYLWSFFPRIISWKEYIEMLLHIQYVIQAFFLSGFILYQSEIENSEMDCQPKASHSAHDGVGKSGIFLRAGSARWIPSPQCLKWHRGGVFL